MVLYHADGRVVIAHENYLEQEAAKYASDNSYQEQIEVCKHHDPKASEKEGRVRITVEQQSWTTLFKKKGSLWENLDDFKTPQRARFPRGGIDRATLMRCSTHADDYFRYNPSKDVLHLPVRSPRVHGRGMEWDSFQDYYTALYPEYKYFDRDGQMAHIRPEEIEKYICPWLEKMEKFFKKEKKKRDNEKKAGAKYNPKEKDIPEIDIPKELLRKIHLYNAMLQLGLPSFIQRPLVGALVAQMYKTRLSACHLDTLEMTVARFYARGVPVLDPVLNHLVGTYAFRLPGDRQRPQPDESHEGRIAQEEPTSSPEDDSERPNERARIDDGSTAATSTKHQESEPEQEVDKHPPFNFKEQSKRKYLEFAEHPADRSEYPNDTFILPPELPVLGHSIRHWSGVRRNGSTAAAHTGYPLNVGKMFKFYRRDATDAIGKEVRGVDYVDYSTYRLRKNEHYQGNAPGFSEPEVDTGSQEDNVTEDDLE